MRSYFVIYGNTLFIISTNSRRRSLTTACKELKRGKIVPAFSRETFDEFRTVLEYPKFTLTGGEIKSIIEEEVLPFFDIVEKVDEVSGVCKDPDDDKFIACALSASANFIVSGDKDLCDVGTYRTIKIIRASALLEIIA